MGGTPVFHGTRVAIQTLFDHLESSSLDNFPEGSLVRDYTGLIDPIANPVVIAHDYSPEGLPLRKRYNYSGRTETFGYEARR